MSCHSRATLLGLSTHPLVTTKSAEFLDVNPAASELRKKLLLKLLLGAAVAGTGAAAITGLRGYIKSKEDQKTSVPGNLPEHLPYQTSETSKEAASAEADFISWLTGKPKIDPYSWEHFFGQAAHNPYGVDSPWAWVSGVPAVVGSTWLGSHLANKYFNSLMKKKQEGELAKAQKDYENILADLGKNEKVSAALDNLYDEVEKQATTAPMAPQDFGPHALVALLAAGAGAYGGYRWSESRKKENLLRAALAYKALLESQSGPSPVTVKHVKKTEPEAKADELPEVAAA